MDELTELEKEIFDAMIGRPFGSSKVYDNPKIIKQAKAAASLCREKLEKYCHNAFLHKDTGSILSFEYTERRRSR